MSETLSQAGEFFKKHKAVVAIGAGGLVLLYLLRGGSSSGSATGGGSALQIAALQSQQNLAQAQIQAQQNTQALGASVQMTQTNDALRAQDDQLAASLAAQDLQVKTAADVQNNTTNAQEAIYKELIDTGATEQQAQLGVQENLANTIVKQTNIPGRSGLQQTGANELALVFGQGNIGSYNAGTSSSQIANTLANASIWKSVIGTAGSVAGGLF